MTRDLALAIGFMTRLPVGRTPALGTEALSRAAAWFPVVGVVVGGVAGGAHALGGLVLGPAPSTVLALLAAVLVTGALHEDGLADTADAIGAPVARARRLEILHDPRVGTYGALALGFALLLAFVALAPLDDERFLRAAIVGHVLARWSTLPLSVALPPSAPTGSGTLVRAGATSTLAATAVAVGVCLAAAGWSAGATALAAASVTTAAGAAVAMRALGGVSGDVFGAVNKLVELTAYLVLAAYWI
jgi:adenosylcobinamide-GDP ribazoletransferase